MIKLLQKTPYRKRVIVAYADAWEKENITTKQDTHIDGVTWDYEPGSIIITSDFQIAMLDSEGNWNWKE